nr:unnamed protein product [Callosobruchus chinensis]
MLAIQRRDMQGFANYWKTVQMLVQK